MRPPLLSLVRMLVLALAAISAAASAPAQEAGPLVSVDWLKLQLGQPNLVILDVRSAIDGGGVEAYARAHIPGAVHSDYDKAGWRATRDGLPFMLPTIAQLEKLIGELGIDEDSRVVIVPAGVSATDFGSATRVYWTLKVAGLSRLSILDGGQAAWVAAGYGVETGTNTPSPTIFTASLNRDLMAVTADVEKILGDGNGALVDARAPPYFLGKLKADAAQAYGHIPGAISLDSETFYDPKTNRLRPRAELAAIAARVPAAVPVVTYCNTGHWASTDWFVLSELLGRRDVRLYYGSTVDWTSDPARPVSSSRTKWDDIKRFFRLGT